MDGQCTSCKQATEEDEEWKKLSTLHIDPSFRNIFLFSLSFTLRKRTYLQCHQQSIVVRSETVGCTREMCVWEEKKEKTKARFSRSFGPQTLLSPAILPCPHFSLSFFPPAFLLHHGDSETVTQGGTEGKQKNETTLLISLNAELQNGAS